MPKYRVQFKDMDVWPIEAETRQQAKRFYCNMMGLTGRDDFIQPGFSVRQMTTKSCAYCGTSFDGTKDQTCCNECIGIAENNGKASVNDLLASPSQHWPDVMREAFNKALNDARQQSTRRRMAPQLPHAENAMLPSKFKAK